MNDHRMKQRVYWSAVVSMSILAGGLAACSPARQSPNDSSGQASSQPKSAQRHSGAHDHDHPHEEVGSHGGHLLDLRSADGSTIIHAEWLHEDAEHRVTVFLMDPQTNAPPADCPDFITIEVRSGKEPRTYTLPKTDSWKGAPVPGTYELVDATLLTGLKLGVEGAEPVLRVQLGTQQFQAIIEHHDHDHHQH